MGTDPWHSLLVHGNKGREDPHGLQIPCKQIVLPRFFNDTLESGIADLVVPLEIRHVIFRGKTGIGLMDHLVPAGEESPQIVLEGLSTRLCK